jgi:uncharacterized membrane protein (UPF0127 family)
MFGKSHLKKSPVKVPLKKYTQFIDPQLVEISIGDHLFEVELCKDFEKGLSQRSKIGCEGMIFIFPEPKDAQFHMKDCKFPLDILFCKDGGIKQISADCPPCNSDDCEKYICEDCDVVVELPAGTCFKLGITTGFSCQIINH